MIARAAVLSNVGLTEFVTRSALRDAQAAIERAEHSCTVRTGQSARPRPA
ncbi:DUF1778 domain-containing protein [Mesorhizobium sp. M7A.F.Ca.US.008.03.1.1]